MQKEVLSSQIKDMTSNIEDFKSTVSIPLNNKINSKEETDRMKIFNTISSNAYPPLNKQGKNIRILHTYEQVRHLPRAAKRTKYQSNTINILH